MMKLYGIALLPDRKISKKIIQFQHDNLNYFKGPELSLNGFLPHTSILQCPFNLSFLKQSFSQIRQVWKDFNENYKCSTLNKIIYHPDGWYFLKVEIEPWMSYFQAILLELTSSMIDRSQIKITSDFNDYTYEEQQSFLKYGYPYVGKAFLPHITLGRNIQTTNIDKNIQSKGLDLFNQQSFTYTDLVIYEAGPNGALAKVLKR